MNIPELAAEYAALKAMQKRIHRRVGQKLRLVHADAKRRLNYIHDDHLNRAYYRSLRESPLDRRYIMPDTLNAITAAMIRMTFKYD